MRRTVLLLACLSLWSTGCACGPCGGACATCGPRCLSSASPCGPNCYNTRLDRCIVRKRARAMARRSLRRVHGSHFSCHFRGGYEQAYVDMAEGGTGLMPAVPSRRYWASRFRSAEGRVSSSDWFAGYSAGASMAGQDGLMEFNTVPLSPTLQLPTDQGSGPGGSNASGYGTGPAPGGVYGPPQLTQNRPN